MNTFSNLTTATEIQRDYKAVSKRARSSDEALIVMLNNKPDLAVMKYDLYDSLIRNRVQKKIKSKTKEKVGLDAVFGAWTKEEFDEFDKIDREEFERIDPEDWK